MKPKRRLTQIFSFMLSGVALASILLIGALWISFEITRSTRDIQQIRDDFIASHQSTISLETNRICDYMEAQRQASEIKFLRSLRDEVNNAWDLISSIDAAGRGLVDLPVMQDLILAGLKGISGNKEGRTNYFVSTLTGQKLLSASEFSFENIKAASSDYANPIAFLEIVESLKVIKEGFFRFNLISGYRSESSTDNSQMAFLKLYEPFEWVIGTSEYLDQWEQGVQGELLDWSSSLVLPNDSTFMILTFNGDILASATDTLVGQNAFELKDHPAFQKLAADIIRGAKDHNKDFITYRRHNPVTGKVGEYIGYYRAIPAWRWVVITWVSAQDLESTIAERQSQLASNVRSQITKIIIISISMLLVIMFLSKVLSALASRSFAAFFAFFENASTSSTEINPADQPFEEFARLAMAANNMISQRKLAKNLLRESELKFKTIFDVSPQVISISDLEGILLDANEEYRNFSKLDLNEAVGRPLEDSFVISATDRKDLWEKLKKDGTIIGLDLQTVNHQGGRLDLLVFGKMIHMNSTNFALLIFTDISPLKAAENEKLVLQEKLSRSTKMEAMGLMAAEVAHDLNNILSGIIGYPQLLLMDDNITPRQKEVLGEILETGQRAAAVVKDLVTIARGVASTKLSMPFNTIVANYTNSPECKQLQEIFPQVRLELELAPDLGNVMASSVHLTNVVMNLVSNAFEAMPPEKKDGLVRVKTEEVTLTEAILNGYTGEPLEPGSYVRLTVSDNGPGIPAGELNKIFEPFYSKKVKGRSGTGLGLAVVWNTILDHQGYLDLESSEHGTSFSIYFRVTEEPAALPSQRQKLDDLKGEGQRILVVDDVDIQRKLALKMLNTLGYSPVALPSGEEAVEYLRQEAVDLVILDMIMHPGMNGRETYGKIMEFKPGQKAIIASGMADTEEVAKAQAMGAGQFVNKPYTIEDLGVAIKKALE